MKSMTSVLEKFQKNGSLDEPRKVILDLASSNDTNPGLIYECGCSLNMLGFYQESIFLYEKSRKFNLPKEIIEDLYFRLTFVYMITKDFDKALTTVGVGLQKFPENNALKILHAFIHYNLGKQDNTLETLLDILLYTSTDNIILHYSREIRACLYAITGRE